VDAAFEMREQVERGELPQPDALWVAAGTIGTAVGLAIGLRAAGLPTRVHAVRTSSLRYVSERAFAREMQATVRSLRALCAGFPSVTYDPQVHVLEHDQVGRGYALPTAAGKRASDLAEQLTALTLDGTYTSKVVAGLMVRGKEAGGRVLYWHTYDGRPLDVRGLGPGDLPPVFRGYFVSTSKGGKGS
ncbi:MAG: pyridoxal-phosphate dependent enzyme, partial [Myxococcota bacterium]